MSRKLKLLYFTILVCLNTLAVKGGKSDHLIIHVTLILLQIIYKLIHSANPQSLPVGIVVFEHVVCPQFSKSSKTKQSKNNVRYWRDCGSGRVDH